MKEADRFPDDLHVCFSNGKVQIIIYNCLRYWQDRTYRGPSDSNRRHRDSLPEGVYADRSVNQDRVL